MPHLCRKGVALNATDVRRYSFLAPSSLHLDVLNFVCYRLLEENLHDTLRLY